MVLSRTRAIGAIKDNNDRKYMVAIKNGDLIVRVAANAEDRKNIKEYGLNCVTNFDKNTLSNNAKMNKFFTSYVEYISKDFDKSNYELHKLISRYVYAYRMDKILYNDYRGFMKSNIMFSYQIKVDEVIEDGKRHRFRI